MSGNILEIYIAKTGEKPELKLHVEVEASKGIVGDRYYEGAGTFSEQLKGNCKSDITFIASEEIDEFNKLQSETMGYGDARRNIVTKDVNLKDLISKEFTIGNAKFRGVEHCEPCSHLANTVNSKVLPHLIHTGLRAAILESGEIKVGDELAS